MTLLVLPMLFGQPAPFGSSRVSCITSVASATLSSVATIVIGATGLALPTLNDNSLVAGVMVTSLVVALPSVSTNSVN